MKVDFTFRRFPLNGAQRDATGLPLSCVVQPFARLEEKQQLQGAPAHNPYPFADTIGRCLQCYSYANCYSTFDGQGWVCSLCGKHNVARAAVAARYRLASLAGRGRGGMSAQDAEAALWNLPELKGESYEVMARAPLPVTLDVHGTCLGPAPVVIALVDVSSLPPAPAGLGITGNITGPGSAVGGDFLELVRSGLEAALEALPPVARVGVITFSDRLGLVDIRGPAGSVPNVRYVPLPSEPGTQLAVPLADVMPLDELLAPVGVYKDRIAVALEEHLNMHEAAADSTAHASTADQQPCMGTAGHAGNKEHAGGMNGSSLAPGLASMDRQAGSGGAGGQSGRRALGPALLALLEYLKGLQEYPFVVVDKSAPEAGAPLDHLAQAKPPAKVMVLLSGPPDTGVGKLVNPTRRKPSSQRAPSMRQSLSGVFQSQATMRQSLSGAFQSQSNMGSMASMRHSMSGVFQPQLDADPLAAAAAAAAAKAAAAAAASAAISASSATATAMQSSAAAANQNAAALAAAVKAAAAAKAAAVTLEEDDMWLNDVPPASREFYEQAAVACAALGVCCDLYCVSAEPLGLSVLEPLAAGTGGGLYLYPLAEESALPQDMYRRLSSAGATQGLLRLRTNPLFKATRFYGRLLPDPQVDSLHHIGACDVNDAFVVEFDYTQPQGFASPWVQPPTIQVAFQYTCLVPTKSQPQNNSNAASSWRWELQRRLRVVTQRIPVAAPHEPYDLINGDAVAAWVIHKVMWVSRTQTLHEARLMLRDWLVNLVVTYHSLTQPTLSYAQLATAPVDLLFPKAPPLAAMPRLVYALLRSPLLAPPAPGQHPDLTTFLRYLWTVLPPNELARAVYPVLTSYTDPDTPTQQRHSLSRAAVAASPAPIFLLDAYILVLVYYTRRCPPGTPFPPPQQSALRKAIAAIRSERRVMPQVRMLQEGGEEAELWDQLLLDEPDAGAGANSSSSPSPATDQPSFGLLQFLEHIAHEAVEQLKAEAVREAAAEAARQAAEAAAAVNKGA